MTSGVLIVGDEERRLIVQAIARAREKVVPLKRFMEFAIATDSSTLDLRERKNVEGLDALRRDYPVENVMLGTYRAAISFEEQPAGVMRHLSVSSKKRGRVPGPEVMEMVAKEFGFSGWPPLKPHRIWLEEFEPGRRAVNLVEIEGRVGHA